MHDELLRLMMRFKLCYEIPQRPRTYIAPQLLSPNQPQYTWDETDNLILRYHYDFMPKGMLTRFIVEMHKIIDIDLVWKDGVILTDNDARAEIIEAYYKNEILIRISGKLKKPLREKIRHEFDKIHDLYNNPEKPSKTHRLRYQEFIPCNCPVCKGSQSPYSYSLKSLETRLKNNRHEIECEISYRMVNVRELIDDAIGQSSFAKKLGLDQKGEYSRQSYEDMREITKLAVSKGTTLIQEQTMSGDKTWTGDRIDGDKVMGDKVAGNKMQINTVQGDAIAGNKIVNPQNLAQAAQDIKALINQLSADYDTTTPSGKRKLSDRILETLEGNSPVQKRALNAIKGAGKAALEEAIDHPVAKVFVAGLEGYLE